MVKFSKELEAQLIPEWREAFVNYWQLKKHVKKIKISREPKQIPYQTDFGISLLDPIRAIVNKLYTSKEETEIIQVKSRIMEDEEEDEVYETELVHLFSEQDEVKLFFETLDEELNKVNRFYKARETEFLERGETLNKQLQQLMDLKQVLNDRRRKNGGSQFLPRSQSSSTQTSYFSDTTADLSSSSMEDSQPEDVSITLEKTGVNVIEAETRCKTMNGKPKTTMKIEIPATTLTRTISAVTSTLWEDLINNPKKEGQGDHFNRKKIQCAEKMIRSAFVELYRGLELLKSYSSLNMKAFTKILKKFDKVAQQQASASYLKVVKRSIFISSDKVVRLMDEVECLFTKHFANSERKKAMKFLKPQHQKETHIVTFFVGLFTGSFVTLFCVYAILAHLTGMFSHQSQVAYMEIVYPVFSMFALLSLHIFLYGCNLFMWKSTRINYNFIFEFKSNNALKFRDAFLICTSLMTMVVAALIIHLVLLSNNTSVDRVNAIPGIVFLISVVLLICPLNIFYRPTRYCFLRVIRNIVFSPLYKVVLVDFFMADQLTSQVPLMRHMETTTCYFLADIFKSHNYDSCKTGKLYRELIYVISFAPYYWRALQCARRWFDEGDVEQLANLGKYASAMIAAGARLTFARNTESTLWLNIVIITSLAATIYQLYWDFVKDWGFFVPNSKNQYLRDELILKNKSIYYISLVINLVLRVAWIETVLHFRVGLIETRVLDFTLASLEVIRRGHWNFYRLENEHLNNVGKFRVVKAVPLPFRESGSDD